MKILHVIFTENMGGMERAYVNLHGLLKRFGHEVVALAVPRFPFLDEVEKPVYFARPRGMHDFLEVIKVAVLLLRIRPDMIITHNSRATKIMNCVRNVYRVPLLAFSHSRKRRRLMGADAVCVLTDGMKQQLISEGFSEDALYTLPNTLMNFPESLLPLPEEKTHFTLGFMGRFARVKGLEHLLSAMVQLQAKGLQVQLRVAGDGTPDEVAEVKRFLAAHQLEHMVELLGWVKDIRKFLAEIDALVVPSLSETFGLVVLEAQAHGRVVIASATDGPSSLIADGQTGYLFPVGDVPAMAEAVEKAMHNRSEWPEIIEKARKSALHYHPRNIEQQVKQVLEKIGKKYKLPA